MYQAVFALIFSQVITAPAGELTGEIEQLAENEQRIVRRYLQRGYNVRVNKDKVRAIFFQRFFIPLDGNRSDLELITEFPALEELSLQESVCDSDLVYLSNLKELIHLDLTGCKKITGSGLVHLRHSRDLKKLNLQYSGMTDAAMRYVAGFRKLQELDIYHSRVTDAGLAHLSGLSQLRELRIGEMKINGSGFRHLRNLPHLKKLNLSYSFVDDAGFRELNGLKNLRELSLYASDVTDSGFVHILNHPKLEVLRFGQMPISNAGIVHVSKLKNLKDLELDCANDSNLKLLRSLKLRRLSLRGNEFTDNSVATLIEMKSLKKLEIYTRGISLKGLIKLENAFPRGVVDSEWLKDWWRFLLQSMPKYKVHRNQREGLGFGRVDVRENLSPMRGILPANERMRII